MPLSEKEQLIGWFAIGWTLVVLCWLAAIWVTLQGICPAYHKVLAWCGVALVTGYAQVIYREIKEERPDLFD